jgi:hypothetical protein
MVPATQVLHFNLCPASISQYGRSAQAFHFSTGPAALQYWPRRTNTALLHENCTKYCTYVLTLLHKDLRKHEPCHKYCTKVLALVAVTFFQLLLRFSQYLCTRPSNTWK